MKSLFNISLLFLLFFACKSDKKKVDVIKPPTQESPAPHAAQEPVPKKKKPLCFRPVKPQIEQSLKEYLGSDLDNIPLEHKYFSYGEFDLNRDGQREYFVALTSPYFCGPGGCTALILNSDFTVNSKITVVDFPIFVSNVFLTEGWYDIFAKSGGTFHRMRYNGTKYPGNPSVKPELDIDFYPEKASLLSYAYILKCRF